MNVNEEIQKKTLNNELCILDMVYLELTNNNILLYQPNSFSKHILHNFQSFSNNSALLVNHNKHDDPPPDFYSSQLNIMFDIFRINDSEIEISKKTTKKLYNPTYVNENTMYRELIDSDLYKSFKDDPNILVISNDWNNTQIHTLSNFINAMQRCASHHIKQINNWQTLYPSIKNKGFLIMDETAFYFDYDQYIKNGNLITSPPYTVYEPWMDKNIVEQFYKCPNCDFVILYMPHKNCRYIDKYPKLVILDTRFPRTDYISYNYNKLKLYPYY